MATVAGIPGGGILNRLNVPESAPRTKEHINYLGFYLKSFDPCLFGPLTGLWNNRIPTFEDYNHLVTPPLYFLISRALSRPQDYHSRNWALISTAKPKLLASLGVRFLLADRPYADPLLTACGQVTNKDGVTLYVYELQGANLGQLSPTSLVRKSNALDTIAAMTDSDFSFHDTAIVHELIPVSGLTRAERGSLFYEKGGVRVRAKSRGPSLLVLPVQFSNSLEIVATDVNSKAVPIRLLRVNLVATGVLFDGEVDFKFAHVFGVFRGVDGRLRDLEDCRRLGIRETGKIPYPPDYQPYAVRVAL